MARVAVVGAGFGGLAAAARLAKLGHAVVVYERDADVGGSLRPLHRGDFAWDAGPTTLTLPAVIRDLFRKSGRPLERVLDLEPLSPGRRHVWADHTELDLPMGSRADQREAVAETLGRPADEAWTTYVDELVPVWDVLRRQALETPFDGRASLERSQWQTLRPRRTMHQAARALGRDERLTALLLDRHRIAGQHPRGLPALFGVVEYVERSLGRWRADGGIHALVGALTRRLEERSVEVRVETAVEDVAVDGGRTAGVVLAGGGTEAAEIVVWTVPRRPTALGTGVRPPPAIPAARTYLGLRDADLPNLPAETFFHGEPLAIVRTGGTAPDGCRAWSVEHQLSSEDVLVSLARRGIDVRRQVVTRVDRSPAEIVAARDGSPVGVAWQGWRTGCRRDRPRTDVAGLFRIGADVHPGPGPVLTGLGAAQVATLVGKA